VLGVEQSDLALLLLTLAVSIITLMSGRTNVLLGVMPSEAHMLLIFQGRAPLASPAVFGSREFGGGSDKEIDRRSSPVYGAITNSCAASILVARMTA
jgi:hypothetical protein